MLLSSYLLDCFWQFGNWVKTRADFLITVHIVDSDLTKFYTFVPILDAFYFIECCLNYTHILWNLNVKIIYFCLGSCTYTFGLLKVAA